MNGARLHADSETAGMSIFLQRIPARVGVALFKTADIAFAGTHLLGQLLLGQTRGRSHFQQFAGQLKLVRQSLVLALYIRVLECVLFKLL